MEFGWLPGIVADTSHSARKQGAYKARSHTLRLAAYSGVIPRESGCDECTIADALGQKTIEMARHYSKGADLTRKMRGVVVSLDAEFDRRDKQRTKIVKPD